MQVSVVFWGFFVCLFEGFLLGCFWGGGWYGVFLFGSGFWGVFWFLFVVIWCGVPLTPPPMSTGMPVHADLLPVTQL